MSKSAMYWRMAQERGAKQVFCPACTSKRMKSAGA